MTKSVPALEKAMKVLRLVAFNPSETFTLSRIAQETKTSPSTCHAIVIALCDNGLLLRHERTKSYSLGAAALELGTLAAAQFPGLPLARDVVYRLARARDLSAVIGARSDDELLIVGHYENEKLAPLGPNRTGFRGPMVPPLGLLFMAWEEPDEVERWLKRRNADEGAPDDYRAELEQIRQRGFWLSLGTDVQDLVLQLAMSLTDELDAESRIRMATELAALVRRGALNTQSPGSSRPDMIGCPIVAADGKVTLTVTLVGAPGAFDTTTIEAVAADLIEGCDEVTVALGGQPRLIAGAHLKARRRTTPRKRKAS